ncbi:hypothetical protein FACS189494_08010 [Spirochaetia bacterium]|nr:hypothetical protein FACS189494_08010 [Spirochaetia bacterium]
MQKIKFEVTDDIIDICRDNVFKAVFTKDNPKSLGALEILISCLIKQDITVTSITANEPPIDSLSDRQIRFDINCKSRTGELINTEMTMFPDDFEPVRLEFYSGKLFTGQNIRGKDMTYNDLKPTYQISFLLGKVFFKDDSLIHHFEYYDPESKVSLGGRSRIITVELIKLDKTVEKSVSEMTMEERWSFFFRYITDKTKRNKINEILDCEEGIAMASEVLISISRDEIERARLISEFKYEMDHQSKMVQAKNRGLEEGRKEGREKGLEEGRNEGRKELLSLLKSGKSPEEIIGLYK